MLVFCNSTKTPKPHVNNQSDKQVECFFHETRRLSFGEHQPQGSLPDPKMGAHDGPEVSGCFHVRLGRQGGPALLLGRINLHSDG